MVLRSEAGRAFVLVSALGLAAGCASFTSVPSSEPANVAQARTFDPAIAQAPMSRLLAGTWHAQIPCPTPTPAPTPTAGTRDGLAPASTPTPGTLFVSEHSSGRDPVREYASSGTNPNPIGGITTGLKSPVGVWVDNHGTLYVADYGSSAVIEYAQGSSVPTGSITGGGEVYQPINAAVDSQGDDYVVNGNGGPVLFFKAGQSTPTIFGSFKYPTSVAFDSTGNVYVVDQLGGTKSPPGDVIKFPAGSQTGKSLGLQKLNWPVGIAIDSSNNVYVSNLGNNTLLEYASGSTTAKRVIHNGICDPVFVTVDPTGLLYVVDNGGGTNGAVTIYKPTTHRPFADLTNGMADPRGVAVNPNWHP